MVIQFLGHKTDGCLDWFDITECTTPTPCPEGCPDISNCNLVVVLFEDLEIINFPATDYIFNDYIDCKLTFEIQDRPIEQGGDISGVVLVTYDANCNPVANIVELYYSDEEEAESLAPVSASLVCS